ncbi:hypothetical protein Acr_27g0001340 [Actinidia rufa]|uniref:Retrotransposon gag domain-containing protein n=1 Tax=Actinidia rufa TaxID=165716 RepID=A0A7J0H609_9ERIC|nr:hypothetical protein Acr_27g0001340 [Actinidia rufa]
MHLRSRNLPRPSASSPPGNRSHPMANPGQAPDLEGLYREIHDMAEQMRIMNENNGHLMQLLAAANPPLPAAPPVPDIERSRHSNRSGDRSQPSREGETPSTKLVLTTAIHREDIEGSDFIRSSSSPPSSAFMKEKQIQWTTWNRTKSLMSLQGCSDEIMCKAFSATLKGPARSWFRKLSPGTIDFFGNLSRLFVANFMSCRNRQKNASHIFTVHQKETESLKDFVKRFNQAILEVEDPSDKRKETRYKRPDLDPKRSGNRRPRTLPRRPEFILPPLNAPVAQVLSKIKHEEFVKWPGKVKTDHQKEEQEQIL